MVPNSTVMTMAAAIFESWLLKMAAARIIHINYQKKKNKNKNKKKKNQSGSSHTFGIIVILHSKYIIQVCEYSDPFFQKLDPKVIDPMTFNPKSVKVKCVTLPKVLVSKSHENTSKHVDTVTRFCKNLNQRSLTPRWHKTPCLLRLHVWLYPRIIVSKSHKI